MGLKNHGIDAIKLDNYAKEIKEVYNQGVQIAIVIGGGNIFRGVSGASKGKRKGKPRPGNSHHHWAGRVYEIFG